MKNKVIEFFQNLPDEKHEQFNTAFELYRKSEGNNESIVRSLNAVGYTESNLQNVLYDLQKLHGITDVEKVRSQKLEVRSRELEGSEQNADNNGAIEGVEGNRPDNADPGTPINDIDVVGLKAENETLLSEKEDLEFEKEVLEDEKSDLQEENETLKEKVNELTAVTGTALREEFPFLNDKECPNELKILVADKMTTWKVYTENHDKLLKIEAGELEVSKEEQAEIAQLAAEAFDENQKIYDELNAYKETGKILGVHPLFKTLQMQREVEEMDQAALIAYKNSSAKYFSTNKKDLAKAEANKDDEKIAEITTRVADRELKLSMVNKKLGIQTK